jgi:group I intron endonuclease
MVRSTLMLLMVSQEIYDLFTHRTSQENGVLTASLVFTAKPCARLQSILDKHSLKNFVYAMEFNPVNKLDLPVKSTLNSIAGVYLCINLVNGKFYVGSASKNCLYRRYISHLLNYRGGSKLVNHAVKKYGLENFAFVVIETTINDKNRIEILSIEQKYIDLLSPKYNIAKIAGSVLNLKWSLESKSRLANNKKHLKHLTRLRMANLSKPVSAETRALMRLKALNRAPMSTETRQKMSLNNHKSVKIVAYLANSNIIYKEFSSIADAAEHFYSSAQAQ